MLMFWKRNEKDERENRKRAEKEALERAKKEEEERESKRQARKLNFTQTELYSHFVGSKIKSASSLTPCLPVLPMLIVVPLVLTSRRGRAVGRHDFERPAFAAQRPGRGACRRSVSWRAAGARLQRGCVLARHGADARPES
jgi:hypothetical protein